MKTISRDHIGLRAQYLRRQLLYIHQLEKPHGPAIIIEEKIDIGIRTSFIERCRAEQIKMLNARVFQRILGFLKQAYSLVSCHIRRAL